MDPSDVNHIENPYQGQVDGRINQEHSYKDESRLYPVDQYSNKESKKSKKSNQNSKSRDVQDQEDNDEEISDNEYDEIKSRPKSKYSHSKIASNKDISDKKNKSKNNEKSEVQKSRSYNDQEEQRPRSQHKEEQDEVRPKSKSKSRYSNDEYPNKSRIEHPVPKIIETVVRKHNMEAPKEFRLPDPKTCVHHGIRLDLFCESCEEPVCRDCSVVGPHNNQLHRLNSIPDSFRIRVSRLSDLLNSNLLEKKEQMLAQIHRIEYRVEEIKDIRAEYNGMLERLRYAEGVKTAVLQHEIHELQKDLEKINEIGESFMRLTSKESEPIQFLLKSRSLYESIEFLISKVFKVNIDVYPYDLPRELSEKRIQLEKAKALRALLDFKDELIFRLMIQKKEVESQIKEELDNIASEEINEWAKLTDKFASELKKYQLVCHYCSAVMNDTNINEDCDRNQQTYPQDFKGYTQTPPPEKVNGTSRHFFAKPSKDVLKTLRNFDNISQQFSTQQEIQFSRMRKIVAEKKIDLQKVLIDHDKKSSGELTQIQFAYILSELLSRNDEEIEKINSLIIQGPKQPILIDEFMRLMSDPTYLDSKITEKIGKQVSWAKQIKHQFYEELILKIRKNIR